MIFFRWMDVPSQATRMDADVILQATRFSVRRYPIDLGYRKATSEPCRMEPTSERRMEVVLQMGHQSLAHRLAMHAREGKVLSECLGMGCDAREEGATTRKSGTALVRIQGCACQPKEFLEAMKASRVLDYIIRVYFFPSERFKGTRSEIMNYLKDLEAPLEKVRIQCSPPSLGKEIEELLESRWDLDPKCFRMVLSVVDLGSEHLLSLLPGDCMYRQPCNEPSSTRGAPSRAVRKLQEAMELLGKSTVPGFVALDMGAAPGSWTSHLVQCGARRVYAIDPAELDASVSAMPEVVHIQKLVQDSTELLEAMQCEADMLVCDMNEVPKTVARRALTLLPFLKKGGVLIVTMKFPGTGREHPGALEGVKGVLGDNVNHVEWHWLMANTLCERCLIAIKS